MRNLVVTGWLVVACSSPGSPPPSPPPPDRPPVIALHDAVVDALAEAVALLPDPRRWFAGDVHMHVTPPDDPADVTMSVAQIAEAARRAKLDFVVLTPHLWPARWAREAREFRRDWRRLAERARNETRTTLVPGIEWTTGDGHFTIAGIDVDALAGADFLGAARALGAFISVNHPFAVPTLIPGVRASHFDMSYRAWTRDRRAHPDPAGVASATSAWTDLDGVEVLNVPLALANLISRPGGRTGEARAWTAANRVVHDQRRRIAAVGGTDNHRTNVMATTWVLATDPSERAILDALRGGATCVGGPEAGSLRIHGDGDTAERWARVGGTVHAPNVATLVWDGTARLFIDDVDRGEHAGRFTHQTGGALHTYRIEHGTSRCGFAYANL